MKSCKPVRSTPGTGMLAMNRKITSIPSVKRILRRRSGILKRVDDRLEHGAASLRDYSAPVTSLRVCGPPTLPSRASLSSRLIGSLRLRGRAVTQRSVRSRMVTVPPAVSICSLRASENGMRVDLELAGQLATCQGS